MPENDKEAMSFWMRKQNLINICRELNEYIISVLMKGEGSI